MKDKKIRFSPLILYAAIAASVIAADQATKYAAEKALRDVETFPLIKGVLHFTYVENRGAAFGMLSDKRWIFLVLSSVALVAMAVFAVINRNGSMIFGGGVGNMIDRIANGFVVDFIDFRLINFWVFNVADSFVCIGCGVLILSLILGEIKSRKEKKAAGGEAGE